ncbi:protein charlatan isoform X1 [Monomorium pharaonis]|uniref:protein charlatan isoform X1 n=1 Tax=Monomorium pharaonis TaxID=307658 RepID=UPI00063F406C|nr:protein charlatan isoform X1 [Monomorium pharaonis]XP_028049626.1 protein charlatan isoform X1 [Monomorium pharaonis]XP_028049627.1 protein charlatan isoform X1 [Monomorium pharaonis]
MEGNGTRMDYEDMFREITKKLYGEDPDHRTSSVQNEFEASVSYKNDDDTENGTEGSDEGNWTYEDEPLKGTDGSRIAAYHAGKAIWRCDECGDIITTGPREIAEHFVEHHPSRILADGNRNRHHSPRKDYLQIDFKIEDIVTYLERLRERAERAAPPSRRTQETQTVPAALLPVTSSFLLQELPSASAPQHLQQNTTTMSTPVAASTSTKRYICQNCPYGTDRRDLFTRHENIHREEKPFHCYVCYKPFNRADHVKKHFMRMHRDAHYDLTKIRRPVGTTTPKLLQQDSTPTPATVNMNSQQHPQQQHISNQFGFASNKGYQLQPNAAASVATGTSNTSIHQAIIMPSPGGIVQFDTNNCNTGRRVQNGGCNSKSHLKGGSKSTQEKRYSCPTCSWTGVDNWCLKRHMNTHTKPYACSLCEYKAARAERLATHVLKVHNRRQCSRCSFLAEDANQLQMHQIHVHHANVSSTSTTQNAPPPSNRHQQPLHPVGGGRPPPGPPVFPAPAPTIAPATTVIPPSTILGRQPSTPSTSVDDTDRLSEISSSQVSESSSSLVNGSNGKENHQKLVERRSRKQSQPKQVLEILSPDDKESNYIPALGLQNVRIQKFKINSKIIQSQRLASKRMFKCHLCPKYAPARGKTHRPYHSRASLTLHTLWRHKRGSWPTKNRVSKDSSAPTASSITLKATFFTNPNYIYDR